MEEKYPDITVKLTGADGNAYNILGLMNRALISGGVSVKERDAFKEEATSGDYDHVIQTCFKWVNVE